MGPVAPHLLNALHNSLDDNNFVIDQTNNNEQLERSAHIGSALLKDIKTIGCIFPNQF